ncbi:MAG: lectin-like protein, partial [Planctomycetota bacterium]|nr:lectin-like protein [Planctomycetota bacterium]
MHTPTAIARTLTHVAATAAVVLPALAAHAQDAVQWRVEDGGNGHWYLLTTGEDKPSWQEASNAAVEMGGHLVTITSQGENDWVVNALGASDEHIGAFQDISADDYSEPGGGWRWVTGEPWSYQNWSGSGPDNNNLEEPSEELAHFCCSGRWNDIYPTKRNAAIEWSADCNGDGIVDYGQILDGTFADEDGNGVPDPCDPVQWRVEDGGNGHWYRGILDSSGPEGITWDEAREIAIGGGGDLASLETQSELEWVYETIGSDPSLWWANAGENDGPYLGG